MQFDEVFDLLPDTIRTVAQLIGLPLTLRLVETLGGTTFPVSKNKTRMGQIRFEALAEVVGVEAADALTRHFGGDMLSIAKCDVALRELRDRQIREEFDLITDEHPALYAVVQLARKNRITDRQIWRILKHADKGGAADTQQSSLF